MTSGLGCEMRLDFSSERVLAVVAHPDDAELLCAGTLARAKADGAAVGVCVLCRGDKGQPTPPVPNLGAVRESEMREAAGLLGAELLTGGVPDGELFDDTAARLAVVELLRRFRPTLVLAHSAADYHPDHRAASAVVEAATWFSASAGRGTASSPLAEPPALWWMDTITGAGFEPSIYIDITPHLDLKRRMLACHRSQLRRGTDTDFAPLDELLMKQVVARGTECGVAAGEAFRPHAAWKRLRAW